MAYEVREGLRRIARDLRDAALHRAEELRDRADTRAELQALWSRIEDLVEHQARPAARQAARDTLEDGREVALDAAERLRVATRANPLLAIGIAVAATWVVTSLLRPRR